MSESLEVNKTLLVVAALYSLGGESDLEHIAVEAHRRFPQQFCWRSFPQFPDKDAVRVHLSEAKKESFGRLVADRDLRHARRSDSYTKRFALTTSGVKKAREVEAVLERLQIRGTSLGAKSNSLDFQRILAPILASTAFQQFSAGRSMDDIGRDDYLAAFKLFPDASTFVITGRITRAAAALSVAPEHDRMKLEKFIEEGRHAFDF